MIRFAYWYWRANLRFIERATAFEVELWDEFKSDWKMYTLFGVAIFAVVRGAA
jgi:hypothetical protein